MPEGRDILGELYSMTILHPGRNAVAGANMRRSFAELSRSHCGGTGEHARLRKAEVQEAEELERRGNRSFRSGEVVRQVVRGRRRLECRSGVVRTVRLVGKKEEAGFTVLDRRAVGRSEPSHILHQAAIRRL